MSNESNSTNQHANTHQDRSHTEFPVVSHTCESSVEKPKTEEPKNGSDKDVELMLKNIKLAVGWLRTHWPCKAKAEVWTAWGTWMAVVAASIYAGLAACQLGEMRTQTNTMLNNQRPWVGVDSIQVQSFNVRNGFGEIALTYIVKNFSATPASLDLKAEIFRSGYRRIFDARSGPRQYASRGSCTGLP
jgi:hypothetical protein